MKCNNQNKLTEEAIIDSKKEDYSYIQKRFEEVDKLVTKVPGEEDIFVLFLKYCHKRGIPEFKVLNESMGKVQRELKKEGLFFEYLFNMPKKHLPADDKSINESIDEKIWDIKFQQILDRSWENELDIMEMKFEDCFMIKRHWNNFLKESFNKTANNDKPRTKSKKYWNNNNKK